MASCIQCHDRRAKAERVMSMEPMFQPMLTTPPVTPRPRSTVISSTMTNVRDHTMCTEPYDSK